MQTPLGEITQVFICTGKERANIRSFSERASRWGRKMKSQEGDRYAPTAWKGEVTRASEGKKVYRKGREDSHFQEF